MRPERFSSSTANQFSGEVMEAIYLGASFKLRLRCAPDIELLVRQPSRGRLPAVADRLTVGIEPGELHLFAL